ncbi:MAG TPA: PilX N-terminal domain-containing pilus assembly protein [Pyrinomonadaceae bacterium]
MNKNLENNRDKEVFVRELKKERGAALAIAIIVVAILSVVGLTALAFSSSEARIAGSDLQRTQTFYAASTGLEKMTNDFSNLFRRKMNPTLLDLNTIAGSPPDALLNEGFGFTQTLTEDTDRLNELRAIQNLPNNIYPRVNIPDGPYAGLYASIIPYKMSSTASNSATRTEVKLEREFHNYLVPLFQFGMFSNEDIEIHPGPLMTFNGRVHSNKNIYALRNTKFLNRLTMAGEFVRDATRGGEPNTQSGNSEVYVEVNGINVQSTLGNGSVTAGAGKVGGPNLTNGGTFNGILRGLFPGSPDGIANPAWETTSVKSARANTPNRFGGQIMTQTTGATALKLPLELAGNSPAEIIKRALPSDDEILSTSRYHTKSVIRILLDDESAGTGAANVAGIPAGKGVKLSAFIPSVLNGGGNVLKQIANDGAISGMTVMQKKMDGTTVNATTVRAVKSVTDVNAAPYVPPGSGLQGRILIEIVKPDGTTVDVTQAILSMGVTEGEPNGIVYLQRPLWAAYVQGSRDRRGNTFTLANLTRNYQSIADGEIGDPSGKFYPDRGFIDSSVSLADDDGGSVVREATWNTATDPNYNAIVPINVYNVREGWVRSTLSEYEIYTRGVTSVVEINMRNLGRWVDGVYDNNLLQGTTAVSGNINDEEGYTVYVSDRRGDQSKTEYLADGTAFASTNGIVDNEDIYGPNGSLDDGEDVIDFGWNLGGTSKKGTLQKDTTELPDSGTVGAAPAATTAPVTDRTTRANEVLSKYNVDGYFRRAVRLFDGDTLSTTAAADKLSSTKGITVSSENMVYIWGNFNTTGVASIPTGGSTLNDGGFMGAQVPASIVCDAIFPLSRTWFDASSALYPEGSSNARNLGGEAYRMADEGAGTTDGTAVRAGIIAGTTVSALTQTPGRDAGGLRRNGGIINYPRFQEIWNLNGLTTTWSYTGSFVPLFRSTQALANWENDTAIIYMPPRRNWSFDGTFLTPNKLPPGTPFFQYVQSTGFRQSLR